jgi:hypothetical protein
LLSACATSEPTPPKNSHSNVSNNVQSNTSNNLQSNTQSNTQSNAQSNAQSSNKATTESTNKATEDLKAIDLDKGVDVYSKLILVNSICDQLGSIVYDGWHFAIYKSKDINVFSSGMQEFASAIGLPQSYVEQATEDYLTMLGITTITDTYKLAAISGNNGAVFIAIRAYALTGKTETAESNLKYCKEKIKEMSPEYESYTKLSTLQSLYSNISDYFEFVHDPDGSFSSLSSTLSSYKKEISNNINNLEFIYD